MFFQGNDKYQNYEKKLMHVKKKGIYVCKKIKQNYKLLYLPNVSI